VRWYNNSNAPIQTGNTEREHPSVQHRFINRQRTTHSAQTAPNCSTQHNQTPINQTNLISTINCTTNQTPAIPSKYELASQLCGPARGAPQAGVQGNSIALKYCKRQLVDELDWIGLQGPRVYELAVEFKLVDNGIYCLAELRVVGIWERVRACAASSGTLSSLRSIDRHSRN
jgi:hypothetical protein